MIYFIRAASGHIKIGRSNNPRLRLAEMQTAHPHTLELIAVMDGDKAEEDALHQSFPPIRGEWREETSALMEYIQKYGRFEDVKKATGSAKVNPLNITRFPSDLYHDLKAAAAARSVAERRRVSIAALVIEAIAAHPDVARQLGAAPMPVPTATDEADLNWD